jgi:magnesium chelatase subunit D
VHATLLAACPWSLLRAREHTPASPGARARPDVRPEDIRIRRFVERSVRTIVFAVDASGSLARSRLAEAKGAIELLLAASYSRRDRACLIAFRGSGATCLLPPTRALARARRELAAMPAGGATPLASGLDLARETCERIQREGGEVRLVIVTDGGANVGRSGVTGRAQAAADVDDAGRRLHRLEVNTLLIDASPRGSDGAKSLARLIGARLVHLGRSDARRLHAAVHAAMGPEGTP